MTLSQPASPDVDQKHAVHLQVDDLVDRVCGIVREIHHFEVMDGQPKAFQCQVAQVADMRRVGTWPADRIAAGTSFGDSHAARAAAIGEAVERYCGNLIPTGLTVASSRQLSNDGVTHLQPDELPSFAPWQLSRDRFPYQCFNRDAEVRWAVGNHLGEPCLVPASLVWCNWYRRQREPRTFHLNYSGIATGVGFADARRRALLEVIERDAVTLWWGLDLPATGVNVDSVDGLRGAWSGSRLTLDVVAIPTQFPVTVMAALATDPVLGLVGAGFACRVDAAEAATKAALEAVQVWLVQRGLLDQDGASLRAVDEGLLAQGTYLPWRADRRYLDDAGPEFCEIRDLAAHGQVWLDDRVHHLLDRFRPPDLVDVSALNPKAGDLDGSLLAAGHRVVDVDLTTTDVAPSGLRVARVVAGGLLPNTPAAYGYYGSHRWTDAASSAERPTSDGGLRSRLTFAPPPHL